MLLTHSLPFPHLNTTSKIHLRSHPTVHRILIHQTSPAQTQNDQPQQPPPKRFLLSSAPSLGPSLRPVPPHPAHGSTPLARTSPTHQHQPGHHQHQPPNQPVRPKQSASQQRHPPAHQTAAARSAHLYTSPRAGIRTSTAGGRCMFRRACTANAHCSLPSRRWSAVSVSPRPSLLI